MLKLESESRQSKTLKKPEKNEEKHFHIRRPFVRKTLKILIHLLYTTHDIHNRMATTIVFCGWNLLKFISKIIIKNERELKKPADDWHS